MVGTISRFWAAIVRTYEGISEHLAEDSIMVFIDDPLPLEQPAHEVVAMALATQAAFAPIALEFIGVVS